MTPTELRFTMETAPYAAELLAMSGNRLLGAEIYTYLRLAPDNAYRQLWAGLDDENRVAAALLDTGETRTLLTPDDGVTGAAPKRDAETCSPLSLAEPFLVMTKDAPFESGASAPAPLADVLELVHKNAGTDEKELMFVYFSRAMNAGLSAAFGEYDEGSLCAAAQILAKNRRCALIGNLFTRPDRRGRGSASRLLAACETEAAKEGLRPVLYCLPAMERFYAARGYRTVDQHEL